MVYVFLADGFEETEAIAPIDILRRAGKTVQTVGVSGEYVTGSHGITVKADILPEDMLPEKAEMIVLPGGMPGTTNLEASACVQRAINYCVKHEKYIGAICAAPSILGNKGLLKGRRFTCYPGYESSAQGGSYTAECTERDGNIITARGAGVAAEFGLALVAALVDEKTANTIKAGMRCKDSI